MNRYINGDIQQIEDMLGPPVDIKGITEQRNIDAINNLAFELYKETSILAALIGSMAQSDHEKLVGVPRNQAICVGLIIRIGKLMLGVVQLSAAGNRAEVVHTLNRCIMEPAINL